MSHFEDQAETLRRLMNERIGPRSAGLSRRTRVLSISSGKGGVGKSVLAANLAAQLARSGSSVILIDADSGLANLDLLFGVGEVGATLEDVADGSARIEKAILSLEPNLWLLPAASGLAEARGLGWESRRRILAALETLPIHPDFVILDTGAGLQSNVTSWHGLGAEFESVVVLTPEPTSLADAYALLKTLSNQRNVRRAHVIVNRAPNEEAALGVFERLHSVCERFIDVEISFAGFCVNDEKIIESVMKRKILLDLDSGAASVFCMQHLAKKLGSSGLVESSENAIPKRVGLAKRLAEWSPNTRFSKPFDREPAHEAQAELSNTAKLVWRTLLGPI